MTPEWLLAGFSEADLKALGAVYTAATPSEANAEVLTGALHDALKPWPWSARRPLRALVAADFAAGETVLLNGWLLSRTEARCCALLATGG